MKKSDSKQIEKARERFYESVSDFFSALGYMKSMDDADFSADDYNQMGSGMEKMARTITRITERQIVKRNENSSSF